MANYYCNIRSNYFHVKDEEKFKDLICRTYGEDTIHLFESKDEDGATTFGFGVYGSIYGVRNPDVEDGDFSDDSTYDEFIDCLQECVADNDAAIIFESGSENLRYIIGSALIVTSGGCTYLDIKDVAVERAAKILNDPNWKTKCEY